VLLAHKVALDPNVAQRIYFARAAGTARFACNRALKEWKRQYKAGERTDPADPLTAGSRGRAQGGGYGEGSTLARHRA